MTDLAVEIADTLEALVKRLRDGVDVKYILSKLEVSFDNWATEYEEND